MKTLQYIIRILAKRWLLLLSLPLVAALVVFGIMSRNPKMYKSSSTIYTGIVSGYDVLAAESSTRDWMSVNNAVDNLMSVIMPNPHSAMSRCGFWPAISPIWTAKTKASI